MGVCPCVGQPRVSGIACFILLSPLKSCFYSVDCGTSFISPGVLLNKKHNRSQDGDSTGIKEKLAYDPAVPLGM